MVLASGSPRASPETSSMARKHHGSITPTKASRHVINIIFSNGTISRNRSMKPPGGRR